MSIIKLRHAADLLVLAYRRGRGDSIDWSDIDAAHEAARAAIHADNRRINRSAITSGRQSARDRAKVARLTGDPS